MPDPDPEHIKFTAVCFFDAYEALDTEMKFGPPKVVCLALADELIIKALLALESTEHGRAHSIRALFEKLSAGTQAAILQKVQAPEHEFLRKIGEQETSDAFVRWRYFHEAPEGQVGNTWTGCLNQLFRAAVEVFEELHLKDSAEG
jgi:HEPN domain-containing protein